MGDVMGRCHYTLCPPLTVAISDVGSEGGGMHGSKNTVSLGFFGKIRKVKQ